jgi:SAM-dependent methyltransferase
MSLWYRLHSRLHWPPRQAVIVALIEQAGRAAPLRRVVDVGCGGGELALALRDHNHDYFGFDPSASHIAYARRHHGGPHGRATFARQRLDAAQLNLAAGDLVVANGVAHHLDDASMNALLMAAQQASFLLICDHRQTTDQAWLATILQSLDRGRFVRPSSYFAQLPGFRVLARRDFTAGAGKLPLWPFFCNLYEPET